MREWIATDNREDTNRKQIGYQKITEKISADNKDTNI